MSRWLFSSVLLLASNLCAASLNAGLRQTVARIPLYFEPNRGQVAGEAQWITRAAGANVYITGPEVVLALLPKMPKEPPSRPLFTHNVHMKLVGASREAKAEGLEPLGSYSSYFAGNTEKEWFTGIPHYGRIRYKDLYPGIDLVYYGNQRSVEYDFVVAPGADPKQIELAFSNADSLRVDAGDLIIRAAGRELKQRKPRVFQSDRELTSGYRLLSGNRVQFVLEGVDVSAPLVIDPVLEFSTYFGGPAFDAAQTVRVDAAHNVYVTGTSISPHAPSLNPFQQTSGSTADAYVLKYSPSGDHLVYAAYFGGSGDDEGQALAIDADGSVYIAGQTNSPDLPLKNALQSVYPGGAETSYVAKISAAGTSLLFSTYFGGRSYDGANAITLDASGNLYVVGSTYSPDFPTKNAFQSTFGGVVDGFVAKFSTKGELLYSTFLGGSANDGTGGIVVDSSGNAYIVGFTISDDFPLNNPLQARRTQQNLTSASFVAKLSPTGGQLLVSTYIGGENNRATSIARDGTGNVYLLGHASNSDIGTKNALQTNFAGGDTDMFLWKLTPNLDNIIYATFLGGTGEDDASDLAVDAAGNAYIAGATKSNDFPMVNAIQRNKSSDFDLIVAEISSDGKSILFSSYLGGTGRDQAFGIALDGNGGIYVCGGTGSDDFPVKNAVQSVFGGGGLDGFLAKITVPAVQPPTLTLTPAVLPFSFAIGGAVPGSQSVQIASNVGPAPFTAIVSNGTWLAVMPATGMAPASILVSVNPQGLAVGSYSGTIQLNSSGSIYTIPVSLQVMSPPPIISAAGVVNAASYAGNSVSPGEIVTIFGANFGPQDNTQVLFDGIAAKVIYVTPAQLSATVPYGISNSTTSLVVQSQIQRSVPVVIPVVPATPAIFTTDASGKGQGAILNQDSSINSATNPAAPGSVVVLYGTGGGALTTDSPGRLALLVSVTIGGIDAPVLYAGIAPGLVSGAIQVNVQIPTGVPSGAVPVILQVGDARSRSDVTLAVQ